MVSNVRKYIAEKLLEKLIRSGHVQATANTHAVNSLQWGLRVPSVTKSTKLDAVPMRISNPFLQSQLFPLSQSLPKDVINLETPSGDVIQAYEASQKHLSVSVSPSWFVQNVTQDICEQKESFGCQSILHSFRLNEQNTLSPVKQNQRVLVEFSSPNIAKPFHAGHLRSTVVGNCVATLHRRLGHHVTSINYLGDWGTQFGYLGVGFSKYGSSLKLVASPMEHLFEVYVKAHKEADQDENFHKDAMNFFTSMEQGDELALEFWTKCRELSVEEYKKTYKRLGVEFDVYDGESMYQTKSNDLVKHVEEQGLLETHRDGVMEGVKYLDLSDVAQSEKPIHANLLKSDGSTLYLTRDIAAFADRKERYDFDRLFYVVDMSQIDHFKQLVLSCRKLNIITSRDQYKSAHDYHVSFGRVQGMSTRRGKVVFLTDILNEAQSRMKAVMLEKETTKVQEPDLIEETADRLAVSALILQNLYSHRRNDYTFSWEKVLQLSGNTGPRLQYQHARLSSLLRVCEEEMGLLPSTDVDFELLVQDKVALNLIITLARFDEVIMKAFEELAPHHIANYLFDLCNIASKAHNTLHVKGQPGDIAQARLLVFACTRQVVANGLTLLGVQPLDQM